MWLEGWIAIACYQSIVLYMYVTEKVLHVLDAIQILWLFEHVCETYENEKQNKTKKKHTNYIFPRISSAYLTSHRPSQCLYPVRVVKYMFPLSTIRITDIVDGCY